MKTTKKEADNINGVSNGGEPFISMQAPYRVIVTIEGIAAILFHRWDSDDVEAKAKAAKGSAGKKTDNPENYVYRLPNGHLALPGEYLRQSIIQAAKFRQDPRSPRKSAMDLYKACVQSLTELADLGLASWDFLDRRRVVIQRSAITRMRPALHAGWQATVILTVTMPQYISVHELIETANMAGQLIGAGDFRPTFGRFIVKNFEVLENAQPKAA